MQKNIYLPSVARCFGRHAAVGASSSTQYDITEANDIKTADHTCNVGFALASPSPVASKRCRRWSQLIDTLQIVQGAVACHHHHAFLEFTYVFWLSILMKDVAGVYLFYILMYMNSHSFVIYFIWFIFLSKTYVISKILHT